MKHWLHRCDRAMIYIFIASSYFPWLTVGTLSCWMLRELRWAIWLLAVLGITYQQIFHERYKMFELLLYLIIGLGPAAIIVTSNVSANYISSVSPAYYASFWIIRITWQARKLYVHLREMSTKHRRYIHCYSCSMKKVIFLVCIFFCWLYFFDYTCFVI